MYISLGQVINGGLHQTSGRGGPFILSCYHICLYRIPEIRVDLCSNFCLLWFTPSHREIFLVTRVSLNLFNGSYAFMYFMNLCGITRGGNLGKNSLRKSLFYKITLFYNLNNYKGSTFVIIIKISRF
jgi:hypothetical protein